MPWCGRIRTIPGAIGWPSDVEGGIGSRRAAQFEHWHLLADADPYRGIKGYMLCVIDHRLSSTESR